ncbi:serine/threonine-protein kinase [Glycomyces harbinensis]|uniref:non-specific serine/threonine protein kinase n=1 Tax=Glycomyces harbinensis TaxID=58114 RepID=A0A1G6UBU8_9ACTN|nr:serine/threonine-protein kinase [Glycomyces harbinensis]SDD38872.1 Serine/threonine protein kinase [Glycomyces harbinensis]
MKPLSSNDPEQIGPYRTIAELGRGAMGRVLLGAGPDGRLVAVKMIREWLVEDEEFKARFREEVRKSRQVSGHYTAAVVKAGPEDPLPWLASEFLRGPTLGMAIEAGGPLPEPAVLRLAAGLASALESIHEAGVIHRDLKPGNILLEASGPRVIDFGIARAIEGSDLTRTGAVIGTPGFMSPEQVRSQPITAASDVFSLGSVLVLACTGDSPFAAASTLDIMNSVVRADPDLDGVPERVRAIAARCLVVDPADRPGPGELLELIGPVAPTSRPWPDAVTALADEQERELMRLLDNAGEDRTLVDNGPTMVTDPNRPTWAAPPAAPRSDPPRKPASDRPRGKPTPPDPPRRKPASPPKPGPEINVPPVAPPGSGDQSQVRTGAGAAAFFICIAVIGALLWYANRDDDEDSGTLSDSHAAYVQDCQDAGYTESECESSWSNDPSSTWDGEFFAEEEDDAYYEDEEFAETTASGPSESEVYKQECQDAGYSQSECDTSWINDPSYTWTGVLYDENGSTGLTQRDQYVLDCQADGYSLEDCEYSWIHDPSYTWTGEIYY